MLFDSLTVMDEPEPHGAALNMAIDEALLESAAAPVLRFYRWRQPAVSFGYFGHFAEVASNEPTRELVRRWTGGGVVWHGCDVTYSVVIPAANPRARDGSSPLYRAIHEAICAALRDASFPVQLATADAVKVSPACFANAVRSDVLLRGRKIAGAAHRRTRAGLLHQGSIQCDELPDNFRERLASALCLKSDSGKLPAATRARADLLAQQKYGTEAWLRRR